MKDQFSTKILFDVWDAIRPFLVLRPAVEQIKLCGSLRRVADRLPKGANRQEIIALGATHGDLDIVFVPKTAVNVSESLFAEDAPRVSLADLAVSELLKNGFSLRKKSDGSTTYGPSTKFLIHDATLLPVDFYATGAENFANVCFQKTGSANHNTFVASRAKGMGLKWQATGAGFEVLHFDHWLDVSPWWGPAMVEQVRQTLFIPVESEEDIFLTLGLEYKKPALRD